MPATRYQVLPVPCSRVKWSRKATFCIEGHGDPDKSSFIESIP